MKRTTLVSGPPGSGKTTGYIENLAKTTDKMIYVLEPVQSIVREKKQGLELVKDAFITNANIEFINYAEGFSDKFYHKGHREDIIIIDEAHTLFFTDYRNFDIKRIEDFLELYDEVIFMTATPHILEIYLRGKGIDYEKIVYKQRLRREEISIRIIPTKFFTFLEEGVSEKYDIIISNNILNIKKLEIELEEKLDDFTFIYSYNNESNNLLFQKRELEQNQWIGTCALGQGLNKKTSIEPGIGRVLMDGNTFNQVPDAVKAKYQKSPGTREHKTVLYTTLAENLIQTDRFRADLDLDIDLVMDMELDEMDFLADILRTYIKGI